MRTFLALVLLAACGTHDVIQDEQDPTIASHPAERREAPKPIELIAVITSHDSKVITADFEGRVDKLLIHNGQRVKAGELVAQLDASDQQTKLQEAEAEKSSAEGEAARAGTMAANARRKAAYEQKLVRFGASAPEAALSAEAEEREAGAEGGVAGGKIREANASIDELKKLIASANVQAPIDGQISMVKVKEGEVARKGTPIARVFDPHDLVIKFAVPHDVVPLIKIGQVVEVEIGSHVFTARVKQSLSENDPTVDITPFEANVDITKLPPDIQVGDSGHVRIANTATLANNAAVGNKGAAL